jgi:subtilisin-like proprotein convertase family protein
LLTAEVTAQPLPQMKQKLLVVVVAVAFVLPLQSATNTFTALPSPAVAIPDNAYNGTPGSMASVALAVPLSGTIQDVNVTLGINHTWIGDLTLKLRSPAGTLITLVSRPGVLEAADDGSDTTGAGDSSNLSESFPITFDNSQASSAETMGSVISTSQTVCQDDSQCAFAPNPGAASPGTLNSFNGQNAAGTWIFYVGDSGELDTGYIHQFSLTIVTPDPPRLQISSVGKNVVIAWPTNFQGFSLEANPSLQTNGWNSAGGAPAITGTNYTMSLPATNIAKFFRLRKP